MVFTETKAWVFFQGFHVANVTFYVTIMSLTECFTWYHNVAVVWNSWLDFPPPLESGLRSKGGARARFPEQRLVIEPSTTVAKIELP